jgi:hypothetical protein
MILGERFRCHVGCEPVFFYEDQPDDRRHDDQRNLNFGEEVKTS